MHATSRRDPRQRRPVVVGCLKKAGALRLAVMTLAILAATLAAACGPTSSDTTGGASPGTSAGAATLTAAGLAGDYPMTAHEGGAALAGPAVVLAADGTYRWFDMSPYTPVSEGTFAIDGDVLSFTDASATEVQTARVAGEVLRIETAGELAGSGDEFTRRRGSGQ